MREKEQSIKKWSFRHILAAVILIVAIMLVWVGFAQLFALDLHFGAYMFFTQIIFYLAVLFAVFYFVIFQKSNTFSAFWGLRDIKKNIYIGAAAFALMVFLTTVIDLLSEKFIGVKSTDVYKGYKLDSLKYLSLVGVLLAPFAEEVFFRGFLQPVFVSRFGKASGILFVCFLFSILHLSYMSNISAIVGIVCVGLILSVLKEMTNSLTPSFVAHTLNNLLAVWVIFYM